MSPPGGTAKSSSPARCGSVGYLLRQPQVVAHGGALHGRRRAVEPGQRGAIKCQRLHPPLPAQGGERVRQVRFGHRALPRRRVGGRGGERGAAGGDRFGEQRRIPAALAEQAQAVAEVIGRQRFFLPNGLCPSPNRCWSRSRARLAGRRKCSAIATGSRSMSGEIA